MSEHKVYTVRDKLGRPAPETEQHKVTEMKAGRVYCKCGFSAPVDTTQGGDDFRLHLADEAEIAGGCQNCGRHGIREDGHCVMKNRLDDSRQIWCRGCLESYEKSREDAVRLNRFGTFPWEKVEEKFKPLATPQAPTSVYGGCYPCPRCGRMMYPNTEHACSDGRWFFEAGPPDMPETVHSVLRECPNCHKLYGPDVPHRCKAEPPAEPPSAKDKSKIWDDCAECARKHLAAAIAAFTTLGVGATMVTDEEVLLARYRIALRESESGYPGNRELAIGCLAMAELTANNRIPADAYREARLALCEGRPAKLSLPSTRPEAWGAAHVTEAFRELPALADASSIFGMVCGGSFSLENPPQVLETLRDLEAWLVRNYELGGGK